MKKIIYLPFIVMLISSCWDWKRLPPVDPPTHKMLGYVPIYSNDSADYGIYADAPRPMVNPGKIYVKGNLIFQNDYGFGIHVFDKTNPSDLKKIGFINLKGNVEMSIKGNLLYANSFTDLLVLDITDWHNLKEVQRIMNAFHHGGENLYIPPPENGIFFQCPDITKGIHVGWKKDTVFTNNCYNFWR